MAVKSVTVGAAHLTAPAGADASFGVGQVGAVIQQFNCAVLLAENAAFTAAGVAMATTTTKAKTVNALTYLIDGVFKTKAGTDNFWTLAGTTVPDGSRCVFLFLIDSAGAATVFQGPIGTTDALATIPSDSIVQSKCIAATLKVVCAGANFVPGTDALNKASVTFTFSDGYDASMVGSARILTII